MSRNASARHTARPRVDTMIGLDTRSIRGHLSPGSRFKVRWLLADAVVAAAQLAVGDGYVDVVAGIGLPKWASTTLITMKLPCYFGGHQTLLMCPHCDSRRMTVYWDQIDGWGCRECLGLAYATSQMSKSRRKFHKMYKAADRAGVDLASGKSTEVKGQHWSTRHRLLQEYAAALQDAMAASPPRAWEVKALYADSR